MRLAEFVGQRLGIEVPDVDQAGGPDQAHGDEHDHARHRGRDYHTMTVSAGRPPCHHAPVNGVHGWRMDRCPARMGVVKGALFLAGGEVA